MAWEQTRYYEFGRFRLDPTDRLLLRDQEVVPLTPKVFDTLLVLVEAEGRVVEKDDIMKRVWPDTFVEEGNLTQNISVLRKALGESAEGIAYVETLPRRGYRFAAQIRAIARENNAAAAPASEAVPAAEPPPRIRPRNLALAGGFTVLLLIVVGAVYLATRQSVEGHPGPIDSIAVLPFANDTSEKAAEHLDEELTEWLINSLSELPKLRVVPRPMVMGYTDPKIDPGDAGRRLGVRAILTGRVHQRGDALSIQAELIDVATLSQIWGDHYELKLSDLLLAQENISREIVKNLRIRLSFDEEKQVEAYRLSLRGRNYWNKRTVEGLKQGIDHFEMAIEVDPSYAPAYAGLADCYNMLVVYGVQRPSEAFPIAKSAAKKALGLDETLAEAHTSLAFILHRWDWDRLEAEREFQLAIKYKPSYAPAHQWYSSYLASMERFDEAIAEAVRTQELEPLSFITDAHLAWIYYLAGRNDDAIKECQRLLEVDPTFFPARRYLGLAYEAKGLHKEAAGEFEQAVRLSGSPLMLALLGHSYAVSGNTAGAHRVLADLRGVASQKYVSPYTIAGIYTGLGDDQEAFRWLEIAYQERDIWLMNLKVDPIFARLRKEGRLQMLIARVGLTP
jgi:DNA-binding winged helix-turn-helix (wHTH) protein/TolB-like protein/Tfp pilus assembly protein PilF